MRRNYNMTSSMSREMGTCALLALTSSDQLHQRMPQRAGVPLVRTFPDVCIYLDRHRTKYRRNLRLDLGFLRSFFLHSLFSILPPSVTLPVLSDIISVESGPLQSPLPSLDQSSRCSNVSRP